VDDNKIDRLFRWIDLIKICIYVIVAGAISLATWATRIQMQTTENKSDIEGLHIERRLTSLETNVEWLKGRGR
jgi:hypothetical protein